MRNNILSVQEVRRRYHAGYPEGSSDFVADIPVLLQRIVQLEAALFPFARAGKLDNYGKELCSVYYKDCQTALGVVEEGNSLPPQPHPRDIGRARYEIPAE
jgi:hypothetical protein